MTLLERAIEKIDAANAQDPNQTMVDGQPQPSELVYSKRMTAWLEKFDSAASEPLQIAVRAQHLRRWEIPRTTFPMTRVGYLQWRTKLGAFHAEQAGLLMKEVGYDDATIARTQQLIRKVEIKSDPETQLLEDVICVVFLENYFADFAPRHEDDKVINILRRTWGKMSERGRQAALKLRMPPAASALVEKALS